jgi:hypothetical protein
MDLADDGIAGDAAQLLGDLRGRKAVEPELGEGGDAVVGPAESQ